MVMRLYLILGLVLLGGTGYFVVVEQPPTYQATPALGEVTRLQQAGVLPTGPLFENEEIEHEIFGVPEEDEERLEEAMANMDMGGMDMGGMDMGGSGEQNMDMDMDGDGVMDMSSADMNDGGNGMEMAEGEAPAEGMDMSGSGDLDMDMDGDGVMDMSSADMNGGANGMEMAEGDAPAESMDMAEGDAPADGMDMAEGGGDAGAGMDMDGDASMEMAEGEEVHDEEADEEEAERLEAGMMAGLIIRDDGAFDREIELSMVEWGFSDLEIDAKAGERIKFTLRNEGKILHEFMFMSMAAMQAVNYRAKRADWNLLEHEALFEKSLLLPGEEITFVAQVVKPGAWMFMCMLPYHMQMGMMGQMATEGMAMDM